MLVWRRGRYKPTNVVITENGVDEPGEFNATFPEVLQDDFRINYFKEYIQAAANAVTQDKACLFPLFPPQAIVLGAALDLRALSVLHMCTYTFAEVRSCCPW